MSILSFRTNVLTVREGSTVEPIAPSKWLNWLMIFDKTYEILNSSRALLSLIINTIWSFMHVSLELKDHCFKLWHNRGWILAYQVEACMNLFS